MKRPLIIVAASLLLASACTEAPRPQADAAAPAGTAATQPSASGQPADPDDAMRAEYAAIKHLARERQQAVANDDPADEAGDEAGEPATVFDCGFTEGIDGTVDGASPQSRWSLRLLEAAKLSAALEDAATKYGYPDEAWEPKLRQYEAREIDLARQLQQIESGDPALAQQRLATFDDDNAALGNDPDLDPLHPHHIVDTDMRAYRQTTQPGLRELRAYSECGAGETPVLVRGEPMAQRIRLIPGFFSEVCKRTHRALDGDDCPYWFEATQEQPMDLAGYYRYEARWPDGGKAVGTADVDKLHMDEDKDYTELVIRDPGAD